MQASYQSVREKINDRRIYKKMSKTRTIHRRADTGTITTEKYAKAHPKTTVKETIKRK